MQYIEMLDLAAGPQMHKFLVNLKTKKAITTKIIQSLLNVSNYFTMLDRTWSYLVRTFSLAW